MSDCPRFGKWIGGCRFEARYDQRTERSDFDRIFGSSATSWIQYEGPAPKAPHDTKTYVRDVCVRCGRSIDRKASAS